MTNFFLMGHTRVLVVEHHFINQPLNSTLVVVGLLSMRVSLEQSPALRTQMGGGLKLLVQLVGGIWDTCLKVRGSRHQQMKDIVLTASPSSLPLSHSGKKSDPFGGLAYLYVENCYGFLNCFMGKVF